VVYTTADCLDVNAGSVLDRWSLILSVWMCSCNALPRAACHIGVLDTGPPLQAPSSADSESLAAGIVRVARRAKWYTLVACLVVGALAMVGGWLITGHHIVLMAAGVTLTAFGAGASADRILADERASGEPDTLLLAGFTVIRSLSILVGVCAAITTVAWLFFGLLGGSHLTWY
jgi:hypothetical protein